MELSDLHIFRTVVQAGGITRAAEQLHRVQSNVTTRIRQLEDKLGAPLFVREARKLHLTPAGHCLLDYAQQLLDLAQEARDAVLDDSPRGALRLGAMESTAAVRLPVPLAHFAQAYPRVRLSLRTGNPQQLTAGVLAGELDCALVAGPVAQGPLEAIRVFSEELVLVGRAGDASPSRRKGVRDVIVFERGCPHRQRLEAWFASRQDAPARVQEIGSYPAMLGCVAAGMGISLVPRAVLATFPHPQLLGVHALPRGFARVDTLLVHRKGGPSAAIAALAALLLGR